MSGEDGLVSGEGGPAVLELGSGDGAFTDVIRELGTEPLTLDRAPAILGHRPTVRGDALRPPFRTRFRVVVAANLLRHVWREVAAAGPSAWRDLVAPGGALWILEDEPMDDPPPARHYRDLQALLARLDPRGRGSLLSRRRFESRLGAWSWPGRWRTGESENRWPVDAAGVAAWLDAGVQRPEGEAGRLAGAIGRDGLAYGRYWWSRWSEETS